MRVVIVGSGPAGFYTVQHLFQAAAAGEVRVDMLDRLPSPFGLVRQGVAPDHPKIKSVTAVYDKLAQDPRFRFFGNVEYGSDVTLSDLRRLYDAAVFCTGAQTDRRMGIPGEDLRGSHPATEFVAWYNGHPDFVDHRFDLQCETACVVGVGNVAVDVARILCRTADELRGTDIAGGALDALTGSAVRRVLLLGRRGPAQAAFSNPEVKELGELADAVAVTRADELELDPGSREVVEGDRAASRKLEILRGYVDRVEPGKRRRLEIRFLVSPVEILGDDRGRVRGIRLVRNRLERAEDGRLVARATETTEELACGLVFRSVGYRGVALAGLPFDERRGVVPHEQGRVVDPDTGQAIAGLYVSGWIKRGPSGVIGTNKPDAGQTVACLLEDLRQGRLPATSPRPDDALARHLAARQIRFVSYADWQRIDAAELQRGRDVGRPRLKMTRLGEFLEQIGPR